MTEGWNALNLRWRPCNQYHAAGSLNIKEHQLEYTLTLSAVEGTIARLISQSDAIAVKQHELVTSQHQLVSSQQHLLSKEDQLVTKQDQLHSAFVVDAVTHHLRPALQLPHFWRGLVE